MNARARWQARALRESGIISPQSERLKCRGVRRSVCGWGGLQLPQTASRPQQLACVGCPPGFVERAGSLPQLKRSRFPPAALITDQRAARSGLTANRLRTRISFLLFFFFNSYLSTYIFTFFNRLRPPAQDRRGSRLAFRGQCFCCSTQVHPSSLHRLLDVPTRGDPGNAFFPPVACVVDAAAGSSACFPSSFHSCFICFFFVISPHIVGRFPAVEVVSFQME